MHICCAFRENMSVKIRNDTNIPGFAPYLHIALSQNSIVNDIKNFVFGPAKASVYGFGRRRKQKFVMSFTISHVWENAEKHAFSVAWGRKWKRVRKGVHFPWLWKG